VSTEDTTTTYWVNAQDVNHIKVAIEIGVFNVLGKNTVKINGRNRLFCGWCKWERLVSRHY
jgi:hypothetical protein